MKLKSLIFETHKQIQKMDRIAERTLSKIISEITRDSSNKKTIRKKEVNSKTEKLKELKIVTSGVQESQGKKSRADAALKYYF